MVKVLVHLNSGVIPQYHSITTPQFDRAVRAMSDGKPFTFDENTYNAGSVSYIEVVEK